MNTMSLFGKKNKSFHIKKTYINNQVKTEILSKFQHSLIKHLELN